MAVTSVSDPKSRVLEILTGDLSGSLFLDQWTKVYPGVPAVQTVNGKMITFHVFSTTDDYHVYKDYGVDYFGSDFEIDIEFEENASDVDNTYPNKIHFCTLANAVEDWKDNGAVAQVCIVWQRTTTARYLTCIGQGAGGPEDVGTPVAISAATRYYLKLVRASTLLTLYVYTDEERSILHGSTTSSATSASFRYLFAIQAPHYAGGTTGGIGWLENLTILSDVTTSITKDDDSTAASVITMYESDDLFFSELFADYDVVITLAGPESAYRRHIQDVPTEADYNVIVAVITADKVGVTATIMQWKAQKIIEALIEAAAQLPDGVEVHLVGRPRMTSQRAAGILVYTTVYTVEYVD